MFYAFTCWTSKKKFVKEPEAVAWRRPVKGK